jgi:hypothetical protein
MLRQHQRNLNKDGGDRSAQMPCRSPEHEHLNQYAVDHLCIGLIVALHDVIDAANCHAAAAGGDEWRRFGSLYGSMEILTFLRMGHARGFECRFREPAYGFEHQEPEGSIQSSYREAGEEQWLDALRRQENGDREKPRPRSCSKQDRDVETGRTERQQFQRTLGSNSEQNGHAYDHRV